jgi:hypothetical protein
MEMTEKNVNFLPKLINEVAMLRLEEPPQQGFSACEWSEANSFRQWAFS